MNKNILEIAINSFIKTKEQICFAIQFDDAVHKDVIRPEHFQKKLRVPEKYSDTGFIINFDWATDVENFKRTSGNALMNAINGAIMICKESYPKLLWVKKEENPDLYAAQMILKCVRDAIGHVYAHSLEEAAPYRCINKKDRAIFEIKQLNISLDTRNLHEQQFKWSHIGGLTNFLRILDYLIEDLKNRLRE